MKFHILSDLHHEFFRRSDGRFVIPGYSKWKCAVPDTDADVVVLAGDIDVGTEGVVWAIAESKRIGKPFIYVPGNHEYYGFDLFSTLDQMIALTQNTGVTVLNNQTIELNGVRILGATLWTDYKADSATLQQDAMREVETCINDHRVIRHKGCNFSAEDALSLHTESREWLANTLSKPYPGKTVVVTHHGPSLLCQHPDFGMSAISTSFLSDLDNLVDQADLWIYGHTHANVRGNVRSTPLVTNQFGYSQEEYCEGFDPEFVIGLE